MGGKEEGGREEGDRLEREYADASFCMFRRSLSLMQVGLLGLQIIWTVGVTDALKNARTDKKIMQATDDHFLTILDTLIDVTTQNLSKIERRKFETLITIHLHQRDIFHALVGAVLSVDILQLVV